MRRIRQRKIKRAKQKQFKRNVRQLEKMMLRAANHRHQKHGILFSDKKGFRYSWLSGWRWIKFRLLYLVKLVLTDVKVLCIVWLSYLMPNLRYRRRR
jgi:Flp pilus assembly protein TadB